MKIYEDCLQPFISTNINFSVFKDNKIIESEKNYKIIIIRSIHRDRDICFNSEFREILYALESYFIQRNKDKTYLEYPKYSENIIGKALSINIHSIPLDPDFTEIFKLFKTHFITRILLLEENFNKRNIKYDLLLKYRRNNLKSYYAFRNLNIPDILEKYIHEFLNPSFKTYLIHRNEFEIMRLKK